MGWVWLMSIPDICHFSHYFRVILSHIPSFFQNTSPARLGVPYVAPDRVPGAQRSFQPGPVWPKSPQLETAAPRLGKKFPPAGGGQELGGLSRHRLTYVKKTKVNRVICLSKPNRERRRVLQNHWPRHYKLHHEKFI